MATSGVPYWEQASSFQGMALDQLDAFSKAADEKLFSVAKKFEPQLLWYFNHSELPEENPELRTRLQKACVYFLENLNDEIRPKLNAIQILSDNQAAKKKATERLKQLRTNFIIKSACLDACKNGFSTAAYNRAKADAAIDTTSKSDRAAKRSSGTSSKDLPHYELYVRLNQWRNQKANLEGLNNYQVLTISSILEISRNLPTSKTALEKIRGLGAVKINRFGSDILCLVQEYMEEKGISTNLLNLRPPAKSSQNRYQTDQPGIVPERQERRSSRIGKRADNLYY